MCSCVMDNARSPIELSPELIKAQEQLEKIRKEYAAEKEALGLRWTSSEPRVAAMERPSLIDVGQAELVKRREREGIKPWKSSSTDSKWLSKLAIQHSCTESTESSQARVARSVKAYPTILNALLKNDLGAPGRIYFLLRFKFWNPASRCRYRSVRREIEKEQGLSKGPFCSKH